MKVERKGIDYIELNLERPGEKCVLSYWTRKYNYMKMTKILSWRLRSWLFEITVHNFYIYFFMQKQELDGFSLGISQVLVFHSLLILTATWNRISVVEEKLGPEIWLKIIWLRACCWGKMKQIEHIFGAKCQIVCA